MEKYRTCRRLSFRHSLVKCESCRCKKIGEHIENQKFGIGSSPWTHVPTIVSPSFLLSNTSRFFHPPDWSEISRLICSGNFVRRASFFIDASHFLLMLLVASDLYVRESVLSSLRLSVRLSPPDHQHHLQ